MLKKIFNRAVLSGLAKDFVVSPVRIHKLFHEYATKRLEDAGRNMESKKNKRLSHTLAGCVSVPASGLQAMKGITLTAMVGIGVGLFTLAASVTTLFLFCPLMLGGSEALLFKLSDAEEKYGMKKQGPFPSFRAAWREVSAQQEAKEPLLLTDEAPALCDVADTAETDVKAEAPPAEKTQKEQERAQAKQKKEPPRPA